MKSRTLHPVKARCAVCYQSRSADASVTKRETAYNTRPFNVISRTSDYDCRPSAYKTRIPQSALASLLPQTDVKILDVKDLVEETLDNVASYTTEKVQLADNTPLVGFIASKNPVSALVLTVQSLFNGGCSRVVVVDDGSDDPDSLAVFDLAEEVGAEVIHLEENMGKSKALKRGFQALPTNCIIVQTDDDTLAGNLSGPARMIRKGKADIVDIRVETTQTHSLLGLLQELDYWLINAVTKRVQDLLRSRLWMSGASVMYSYEAGRVLILHEAETITEDTEGLFRARTKGFKVRFYSKHDGQFLTMVPEDFSGLHKQWKRWSIGGGQVIGIYGMGGGNARIAFVNIVSWFDLFVLPPLVTLHFGIVSTAFWAYCWGIGMGIIGAIRLKRWRIALVGMFLPYISIAWGLHALQGLVIAFWRARTGKKVSLTWVSPKRTTIEAIQS